MLNALCAEDLWEENRGRFGESALSFGVLTVSLQFCVNRSEVFLRVVGALLHETVDRGQKLLKVLRTVACSFECLHHR